MSGTLRQALNRRSTSPITNRSQTGHLSYLPSHESPIRNHHSEAQNNILSTPENPKSEQIFPSSSERRSTNYESNITLCKEIERLCETNYQLNEDNKILAEQLNKSLRFEEQAYQLENQNKQLLKEIAKKDELLAKVEQETSQISRDLLRKSQIQPGYGEILTQNKALVEEISLLKAQLAKQDRSLQEASQGSPHKTQFRLEQVHNQLELLKEDLVRKNFKIEEMTDVVNKLTVEKNQLQHEQSHRKQIEWVEKEELIQKKHRLEVISLEEELETVRSQLKEVSYQNEEWRVKEETLRRSLLEAELETKELRQKLVRIQDENEEEWRVRERSIEIAIKAKSNDAIKQMLKEKVQYEEMIQYLKERAEELEKENAALNVNLELERRQLEEEKKTLNDTQRNLRSLRILANESPRIERGLQEALRNEEDKYLRCKEDLELAQIKIEQLEREIFDAREFRERWQRSQELTEDLQEEAAKLKAKNATLEARISDYQNQLANDDVKVLAVTKDCENLAALYTEIEEQLETERQEKEQLAGEFLNKMEQLEAELNSFKSRELDASESTSRWNFERKNYEKEIQQFKLANERTREELEGIYRLLAQGKQEADVYIQQNEQLKDEVERLQNLLKEGGQTESQEPSLLNSEKMAVIRLNKLIEERGLNKELKSEGESLKK